MALPRPPAQVTWLFADADRAIGRELLDLAAVLELQGIIKNWSRLDVPPGQSVADMTESRIHSADIVMVVATPSLFSDGLSQAFVSEELAGEVGTGHPGGSARWVLVRARTMPIPPELAKLPVLPRDGEPIVSRKDRREGLLDVIRGLQEMVQFDPASLSWLPSFPDQATKLQPVAPSGVTEPMATPLAPEAAPGRSTALSAGLSINDIFRLDGPPTETFVEPPQFAALKLELRTMGTGLIVEGPSKVGKSTAIKKALGSLGVAAADQIWWHGQEPPPIDEFRRVLKELRQAARNTWLFIDDFHYLEAEEYRRALAISMKLLADEETRHAKVTLIGINPLGSSLVQVMPDLAGRFRVLRIDVEKDLKGSTKIAEVIILGERAANIRFRRRDEFVIAAGGSFFLAQWLCNRAAVHAGVHDRQPHTVEIDVGPVDVVAAIQDELEKRFRMPMLEFASFDVAPPPRGAGLSLLWLLSRSTEGFVPVKEARLRFPMLEAAFDWFLVSNLSRCFQEHSQLRGLLYYNRAAATLTMEDPQLRFFLRELDWAAFADASGHGRVSFDPQDGPLWPRIVEGVPHIRAHATLHGVGSVAKTRRLLHLSDLHLTSQDQATISYAQLAADLRQQGVDALDALVVSGDLVNRAVADEYDAARLFLDKLMSGFGLSSQQVVLVPGNHDVSWASSRDAYSLRRRSQYRGTLVDGSFIKTDDADVVEVRDDEKYRERFQPFADLYRQVKGVDYPLDYAEQATFDDPPGTGILALGLNSAWEIDHHYKDRASIHAVALARALEKLGPPSPDQLRIAVFHHPIHSGEDARLRDAAFLEQLAVHGFQLALHGHVHRADNTLFRYDRSAGGRHIDIVAAGTFGARSDEWVAGIPLQYNLLLIEPERITVETRCRENVNGAWKPDARWLQGERKDPLPRYVIER